MSEDRIEERVRLHFSDGSSQDVVSSTDLDFPARDLGNVLRLIIQPTPASVEVISTATPELPSGPTAAPEQPTA